jgi:hypothetical protein
LAYLWSSTSSAIAPATAEQMVCVPSLFVVATVTDQSPSVSVPEFCKDKKFFCGFEWPLTIRVDQVLAARLSGFSPEKLSGFQRGSIIDIRVTAIASRNQTPTAPNDGQGGMSTTLSEEESTNSLRGQQFIFGFVDGNDRSQIWSMSFRGRLEKTLIEAASGEREDQRQCPRLMN